ncbi:DUF3289 family protein [Pantoea sp. CCBC3-3-1]|uniref:DUF3289 family protein n=1 Tax=Pantoea sp. CCBC3-3-1 TaxID=2490851 RepID=UPI0011BF611B|nr:DUF3289 family protein [Pantoea sp. CCBC3-3-1]
MSDTQQASSTALSLPHNLFTSQKRFDKPNANDMQCGDLSERELKERYGLKNISETLDPWTDTRLRYPVGNYAFAAPAIIKEKIDRQKMTAMLFDEMRTLSRAVSFFGYRELFLRMVNHFQTGNGAVFRDPTLDFAYKQQIINDTSKDSTLKIIKDEIINNIDWEGECFNKEGVGLISNSLKDTRLPKFDRWKDGINGLGISVHDVYATKITLFSLELKRNKYTIKIHYQGQDHFGLDNQDIMKKIFHNVPLFRIWFLLQRWDKLGFKPFMVNMEAMIEIKGERSRNA